MRIWEGTDRPLPRLFCGSGLARDGINAVLMDDRGASIASKPLPHGVITVLLFDNPSPAHPRLQIVENNIPTLPKRDIKPL